MKAFDADKYLKIQSEKILERTNIFDKLYLEFGGKLLDDQHAARCIPGFEPDLKIRLLETLKDKAEVILCISARAIAQGKERADYHMTYDRELILEAEALKAREIEVSAVVITLYEGQPEAKEFAETLKRLEVAPQVYLHSPTKGYPTDVDAIVSDEGYGKNAFVRTSRPLVIVTAPGPCSGKMATALSQLYHEGKHGVKAGYAKFETFPVWSLPLKHPLNLAYEAATADLGDVNMIDHYHLDYYGETAVNYNRDLEIFPVLQRIITKIKGDPIYHSPTDMGVNMVGFCITDDQAVREASIAEIKRRYEKALVDGSPVEVVEKCKLLVDEVSGGVK